jgi:hypothetical protein
VSRTDDPTVRAVEDALAFTTAAVAGDVEIAVRTARQALEESAPLFLDAVVSTVQLLADEALSADVDVRECLRDVALGVQLAYLTETGGATGTDLRNDPPSETRS